MNRLRVAYAAAFGASALVAIVAAVVIITSPGSIGDVDDYEPPASPSGDPILIGVAQGESPETIGSNLEELGVIESGDQFEVLVSLMGFDRILQAGEYEFGRGTPALEVIYRMRRGIVATKSVTVVEGWRLDQIADAVAAQGIDRAEFIAAAGSRAYDYQFVQELPEGATLEGYLYPATYTVLASETPHDLVQRMLQTFADNLQEGIRDDAAVYGLTLHDVVTIASIIEREARVEEEKPIMAQVFLTRLRVGIALAADPTVQYAITAEPASVDQFGYWKPGLTLDDLAYDSPYNTYVYQGVPPGPIASPSASSITAVVQPSDTNYLYFVAKPDGSHAFAETLDEHIANIEMYQTGGGE